jgi:hypothetical protein
LFSPWDSIVLFACRLRATRRADAPATETPFAGHGFTMAGAQIGELGEAKDRVCARILKPKATRPRVAVYVSIGAAAVK